MRLHAAHLFLAMALPAAALLGAGCDPPAEAALAREAASLDLQGELRIDPKLKNHDAHRCMARALRWHDYDTHIDVLARVTLEPDRPVEVVLASDPAGRVDEGLYRRCLDELSEEAEPGTRSHAVRAERGNEEGRSKGEARGEPVTLGPIPAFDGPLATELSEDVLAPYRAHIALCHAAGWAPSSPKYTDLLIGFAIGEDGRAIGLRAVMTIGMNDGIHRCIQTKEPEDLLAAPEVALRSIETHRRLTEVRIPLSFRYKGNGHVMRRGEKSFTSFDFGL